MWVLKLLDVGFEFGWCREGLVWLRILAASVFSLSGACGFTEASGLSFVTDSLGSRGTSGLLLSRPLPSVLLLNARFSDPSCLLSRLNRTSQDGKRHG